MLIKRQQENLPNILYFLCVLCGEFATIVLERTNPKIGGWGMGILVETPTGVL